MLMEHSVNGARSKRTGQPYESLHRRVGSEGLSSLYCCGSKLPRRLIRTQSSKFKTVLHHCTNLGRTKYVVATLHEINKRPQENTERKGIQSSRSKSDSKRRR